MRGTMLGALVLIVLVTIGAVAASNAPVTNPALPFSPSAQNQPMPDPSRSPGQPGRRVDVVARGLEVPWALAFAPDGHLFFTERPGRIRVIADGVLQPEPVATLTVASSSDGESGLMGIALDPAFQSNGYLYAMYTHTEDSGRLSNRISRLRVQGNRAGEELILLDGIRTEVAHEGGRLKFGPDGKLYATTGDGLVPKSAQGMDSLNGKVLRLNPDGSMPADNPFPGSFVYTLGHRDPEGLAFQPGAGALFSTEQGPSENDEVNIIQAGRNYGWPAVQGLAHDPRFADPIVAYDPKLEPSGATFYSGARYPAWNGNLFFAALASVHLHRMVLGGADGKQVVQEERLFEGAYGRLRDVAEGPDGYLYFATSNRDGRGTSHPDDDQIIRILPQ